jgi:AraC-like DNA-binding protein
MFFLIYTITQLAYIYTLIMPNNQLVKSWNVILGLSLDLMLAPLFWWFLYGVTANSKQSLRQRDFLHLIPFLLGLLVSMAILILPKDAQYILLYGSGDRGNWLLNALKWAIFFIYTLWVGQCCVYSIAFSQRLVRYQAQLRILFSSQKSTELQWTMGLITTLSLYVFYLVSGAVAATIFALPPSEPHIDSAVDMLLVWMLCAWSMRQKPGLLQEIEALKSHASTSPKYEKSGLSPNLIKDIAKHLQVALVQDKLFKDPELSLRKLSTHISEVPNYVTQTLNTYFEKNFYDFINGYRIEEAKRILRAGDSNVADIAFAVGFNSTSAFYTAFKKLTSVTPSAFRKANINIESLS